MYRRNFLKGAAALAAPTALATPSIAQPAKTATLRFVPQANLSVLDPIWTTATVTNEHGYYVFDTLYSTDSRMRPQPQMAEGHEVSGNGRLWRIRLREGLKFHDGTPVRAIDCVASLQRWARRESFGQLLAKVVDRWAAPDDRTIEIHLTRPFPLLLDAIGKADSSVAFIMPERLALTDANTAIKEMVGSGPYRFIASEFNSGSRVIYEKFDGYVPRSEKPDWATGAKIAYFPRVEWTMIPDPATAAAALQNGEIDWWERPLSDLQPALLKNPNVAGQVADPGGRLALMRLNHLQPPFNDVRLRRAVRLAVIQEDYMRAARGDDTSLWTTCRSLYPKDTPYYRDAGPAMMPGNLDAARAALKEAGYAGQKVVIINPTDFPDIGPLGQVTADALKRIGMNVDLQESDWGTVVQRRASREPVEKGGWSIFHTTGSAMSYASPAVSPLVRGQGAAGWFGWWTSAKAEEMTQEWLEAPDDATQARVADAIGALAMDEVATIPLGQFYIRTLFRRSITGVLQGVSAYPWNVRPA
ncbi:ABC transporter substrate-binding protein [Limobrevibacterium gyesilva]|uniref:ABC transporter substrate-binding protein n=1 Tax=Limobrevibacterium gyesilva TaxID=2991712 RepID=A0AA41YT69_9PROT|nr:ABC transporter substrate-binding protein [Limobrevibacterium gyesilva]MCW3475002.1 ABC transporter substrate-binding protein [Limobrevibacterium gyesilva]